MFFFYLSVNRTTDGGAARPQGQLGPVPAGGFQPIDVEAIRAEVRREYAEYLRDAGYDAHDQRFGPLTVIMGVSRFVAVHVPGSLLQAVLRLGSARGAQNHCEYIFDCQFKLVQCSLTCLNLLCGNVCSGFVFKSGNVFSEFCLVHPVPGAVHWHGRGLLSLRENRPSCFVNVGAGFADSSG